MLQHPGGGAFSGSSAAVRAETINDGGLAAG
jgi:hypothetical protein